jgi:hypothetical protein
VTKCDTNTSPRRLVTHLLQQVDQSFTSQRHRGHGSANATRNNTNANDHTTIAKASSTVGGIRNQAFRIPKNKKRLCERPGSKTPETADSISTLRTLRFGRYPSSPTKQPNESSMAQGVEVSLDNLFRDETSGANIVHSGSLGLVFAQGVSSSLTLNQFKLEYGFCFR